MTVVIQVIDFSAYFQDVSPPISPFRPEARVQPNNNIVIIGFDFSNIFKLVAYNSNFVHLHHNDHFPLFFVLLFPKTSYMFGVYKKRPIDVRDAIMQSIIIATLFLNINILVHYLDTIPESISEFKFTQISIRVGAINHDLPCALMTIHLILCKFMYS